VKLELLAPAENPYMLEVTQDEQMLKRTVNRLPGWNEGEHVRALDAFLVATTGRSVESANSIGFSDSRLSLDGPRPIVEAIELFLADRRDMDRKGEGVLLSTRYVQLQAGQLPGFESAYGQIVGAPGTRELLWGVARADDPALTKGSRLRTLELGILERDGVLDSDVPTGDDFGPFAGARIAAGATLTRKLLVGSLEIAQADTEVVRSTDAGWRTHRTSSRASFALRVGEVLVVTFDVDSTQRVALVLSWKRTQG
jgi:hypothetical protein